MSRLQLAARVLGPLLFLDAEVRRAVPLRRVEKRERGRGEREGEELSLS